MHTTLVATPPSGRPIFDQETPTRPFLARDMRAAVRIVLAAEHGIPPGAAHETELIISELVGNCWVHRPKGLPPTLVRVTLVLIDDVGVLHGSVHSTHHVHYKIPTLAAAKRILPDERRDRGRGLAMLRTLSSSCEVVRTHAGHEVRWALDLSAYASPVPVGSAI